MVTTLGLAPAPPPLEHPWRRVFEQLRHPLPLLRYLVMETETHALCAAIAFFASLGFYPSSFLLLTAARKLTEWGGPQRVVIDALREYYPEGQAFLLRNLDISIAQHGRDVGVADVFWILLGAAGVFVPLETALNRLWGFSSHRPYWKNQAVGFLLTVACCALAVLFVLGTTGLQVLVGKAMPTGFMAGVARYAVFRATGLAVAVTALVLLFRYLPNGPVQIADIVPAAMASGVAVELVRAVFKRALPLMDLARSQGPYHVSVSFALLVYAEAFVVLGGAFLAVPAKREGEHCPPAE